MESLTGRLIFIVSVVLAMNVCTTARCAPHQSVLNKVAESRLDVPNAVRIARIQPSGSPCYDYAVSELQRLLRRVDTSSLVSSKTVSGGLFALQIIPSERTAAPPLPPLDDVVWDGYALSVCEAGICIAAREPKGVLNGVYDLAERLGYLFLYPGTEGEWPPERYEAGLSLPHGTFVVNPRFPYRGIFDGTSDEEWLAFYAKMRLNALSQRLDKQRADTFGFRLEHGGHQLDNLLPKDQFATNPALFRMAQPEDFSGERVEDYNFCITSPEARKLIKENYRREIRAMHREGFYAWHTWHEDLPAGGWCLCPTCRSFNSSDLAMLAMSTLAEVVREENLPMRVPFLAYHDTLRPGLKIDPPNETFLLFAPRDRCYAHALDEPSCPTNRRCHRALKEWMERYKGISDAHTFEYYLDRVLFRGLYPFLPEVIIQDARVYEEAGIESHMVLQVGTAFVPRMMMLNLPLFGRALWDETLTGDAYAAWLGGRILPEQPQPWQEYIAGRADVFSRVMKWEHAPDGWSDYRWIPETTSPYGEEMAKLYEEGAECLDAVAAALSDAVSSDWPERVRVVADTEIARTRFEAAELKVMAHQQAAANHIGQYLNGGAPDLLASGTQSLMDTLGALDTAREKAEEAGIEKGDYYYMFSEWIKKELTQKLARWRAAEAPGP